MSKITKTIRVDESLWQEVKIHVAKNNTNISSFVDNRAIPEHNAAPSPSTKVAGGMRINLNTVRDKNVITKKIIEYFISLMRK